ncbi:ComEC/Rec2 family competence protein [Adhaeribacter aquaticus]|uniref:ComEC/Rec2 family competence protein n=1 Tax=Adhaeribacter aquaticus TaxID=299567 RepID=UPI0003F89A44|nr:MBL fold metallo-hydrolase [Adhaeribacter aquaticus]
MKKNHVFRAGALAAAIFMFSNANTFKLPSPKKEKAVVATNLSIYWVDTEGGAATLIVTPAGESVLIDTGNPGERDASRIYKVAHDVAGLSQIDHLVTTHFHGDHYGGAASLAKKMPIVEVLDKGIPNSLEESPQFAQQIQPYRDMEVKKRTLIKPGDVLKLKSMPKGYQNLAFKFVGMDRKFVSAVKAAKLGADCGDTREKPLGESENYNGTVMMLDYGPFRFFDGADITWNVEKTLVCPKDLVGTVDVYQVTHHGLDQSNNPVLVRSLAPVVTVMGNGTQKGAGPETVKTLQSIPTIQANYQLHKNLRKDSEYNTSEELIANMVANCDANYVKLEVAPDGKTYTVSIPATNHARTFKTKSVH